ncbi:MAG: esterase family protein [Cyclobacteriaceae bacterium]|nr:esterase family protein [Cyclobacteriaceae bacterium]
MYEHHHRWYSPRLGRDIDVLAFGTRGYPVILFPTSMGRYYENKDFKLLDSVAWFVDNGLVKIYCPDSIDEVSWYNKNIHPADRVRNHIWYDQMIRHELVPLAQRETGVGRVATAGCSFGGYHATNFGFRYPEVTKYVFNMGAAFDIRDQVDGHYNDDVYFNNPLDFLPDAHNPHFQDMFVVLGTGTHDMCWDANEKLAGILRQKGIQHWLDVRHEAPHDWPAWREMFPHYLSLIK